MYRHLTRDEKESIVNLIAKTGYAEVLRLLGGLINNEIPNNLAAWQDGSAEWAKNARHSLVMLAHDCYNRLDNKTDKV